MAAETAAHNLNVTKGKRGGKRKRPPAGAELVATAADAKKHIASKRKCADCGIHFSPRFAYFTKCDNCQKAHMEEKNQSRDSLAVPPGEQQKQDAKQKQENQKRWAKKKDKDKKKKACCDAVKEESLENKKQKDTAVPYALLKIFETLPADTNAFLQPALAPPAASKKRSLERFLLKLQRYQSPRNQLQPPMVFR